MLLPPEEGPPEQPIIATIAKLTNHDQFFILVPSASRRR
jgi:hypothetical protein